MKKIFKIQDLKAIILICIGILLGWVLFHSGHLQPGNTIVSSDKHTIWTCSMHPQIRQDHPGQCPICGMNLIPLEPAIQKVDSSAIVLSEEAAQLADIQTTPAVRKKVTKNLRLYGKVDTDEQRLETQPAYVPGRIEKLLVNYTGEPVKKGQTIALIYSPDLITAQNELLEALNMKEGGKVLEEAAREKLRLWKLTKQQIDDIENSKTVKTLFEIKSNVSGVVLSRYVSPGDYVSAGTPLFDIADLSRVWVQFDAYETDLPWIRRGNTVQFVVQSIPGKTYRGIFSFVDPVIQPDTRVARARVEISNPDYSLKPGMFVTGEVKAQPVEYSNALVIPASAILWTGKRSVVYLKQKKAAIPTFEMHEITLGPASDNGWVVLSGLEEGDMVVSNGTFAVDAAAQLAGKHSMMNPPSDTQ